jgi:hypothetical protein
MGVIYVCNYHERTQSVSCDLYFFPFDKILYVHITNSIEQSPS